MKILEKATMPDGTKIQCEDWHEDYDFIPETSTIAAYPICKMYVENNFAAKLGRKIRAAFQFGNAEEAKQAFEKLASGTANFEEYAGKLDPHVKIEWITGRIKE